MNSAQDLTVSNTLPPFSPIKFEPPIKHMYPFETEYSREPERVRMVFDELVEKTRELNLGKPQVPFAKRRARRLGLKVSIEQAKGLHWRSIQARQPVQLTAGPNSPLRTPRRPATDYPSAEQLCLKNMADAQKKQNYAEACRWSIFAERERAISKWEADQVVTLRMRRANSQAIGTSLSVPSPSASSRRPALGNGESEWEQSLSLLGANPSDASRKDKGPNVYMDALTTPYRHTGEPQYQTVVEMPVPLMDRSQNIRSEAYGSNYTLTGQDQMQSFNIPRGSDLSVQNSRLTRSSSMQRHIPTASLRMAPTPLRPRIDHYSLSYPTPQASRLSYIQPSDSKDQGSPQNNADSLTYSITSNLTGMSSNQTPLTVPSMGFPGTPDQTFADESSLKKRRSEAEHYASSKSEQRKHL